MRRRSACTTRSSEPSTGVWARPAAIDPCHPYVPFVVRTARVGYASGMATSIVAWNEHFVAYESALASFYALQDAIEQTVEHSRELVAQLDRITSLREPLFAAAHARRRST